MTHHPNAASIITGATSGIGRAIAFELAGSGQPLLLVGRRQAEGDALATELTAQGHYHQSRACHVGPRRGVDQQCGHAGPWPG